MNATRIIYHRFLFEYLIGRFFFIFLTIRLRPWYSAYLSRPSTPPWVLPLLEFFMLNRVHMKDFGYLQVTAIWVSYHCYFFQYLIFSSTSLSLLSFPTFNLVLPYLTFLFNFSTLLSAIILLTSLTFNYTLQPRVFLFVQMIVWSAYFQPHSLSFPSSCYSRVSGSRLLKFGFCQLWPERLTDNSKHSPDYSLNSTLKGSFTHLANSLDPPSLFYLTTVHPRSWTLHTRILGTRLNMRTLVVYLQSHMSLLYRFISFR